MDTKTCGCILEGKKTVSRCMGCVFAVHEQFKGYPGRWLCFHPHRRELSNRGTFTYPANENPRITICTTSAEDYDWPDKNREVLKEAKTPIWCYLEAVERAQAEQLGFDPDVQREILWPSMEQRRKVTVKQNMNQ